MNGRTIATGLVVAMLLVSVVPMTALAQTSPRSVLLNESTTHVGSVTVDGQQYEVYRYENAVWLANGIDIYADGERVTAPETAEEVLTALAQRRAVEELEADHLATLRTTAQTARATAANASAAAAAVNETTAYLAETKTVREDGRTVYNASVEAAPRITEFNETARDVPADLRDLEAASTAYASNATELATLLERRQNGSDVDPQRLYAQYEETLTAKYEVGAGGVSSDLATLARLSEPIAANVSSAPQGEETARKFETVHEEASLAANRTDAFTESVVGMEFDAPQGRFHSLRNQWMQEWRSRRDATLKVYGLMTVVGAAVVGGIGLVGWRRR